MSRFRLGSLLALAGVLITVGGCAESPSAPAVAGTGLEKVVAPRGPALSLAAAPASAVIGPEGGTLATASGHRIVFPAGALSAPTEISIRDDARFVGVHLEPHGLVFPAASAPVLTLNLAGADVAAYDFLRVIYVDDAGRVLEVLPTGSADAGVHASLRHFSGYLASGGRSDSTP